MTRYPTWKYYLIAAVVLVTTLLALPNLYGKDPALQISAARSAQVTELTQLEAEAVLDEAGLKPAKAYRNGTALMFMFDSEETQLRAQEVVQRALGRTYIVALNLAAATPDWLRSVGLEPMYLGLDLRGGVHFLMEVDMAAAMVKADERYVSDFRALLREKKIRYRTLARNPDGGVLIRFRDAEQLAEGQRAIGADFTGLEFLEPDVPEQEFDLIVRLPEATQTEIRKFALQQNITTLRKRVNELGVAEPVVQQQGLSRIVVQLPGVQDTARAKDILGATATLEFRMVDEDHNVQDAVEGRVPAGSRLYHDRDGQPVLLKLQVLLTGDYIIDAASGIDPLSGGPDVSITLDGKGAQIFSRATKEEVGRRMAVVFIETKSATVEENGRLVRKKELIEEVINVATIKEQLGKRFHITGLDSPEEARNLALLLRAGALAAPIEIIEERTIGPSLGQENIDRGVRSTIIGMMLTFLVMGFYYRVFGMIADIALALNLVMVVALMSLLQATLTLPGIAGMVLTVGMAVDANVLINERIREELRNGNSPHNSIQAGYDRAFITIFDSNITTLIAAVFLFGFGTGPIKGFAVTLSLGIISSMFTAITVTRGIVHLVYGGRRLKSLSV